MTESTKARTADQRAGDDLLNDRFHTLLRDAAEKREGRELIHSRQNQAEAKQESDSLLDLARNGEQEPSK
jgi:hypothetical protein